VKHDRAAMVGYRLAQLGASGAVLGGLVDTLVPRLLPHHEAYLGVQPGGASSATTSLVLLLLHTLGVALFAVGIGALALLADWRRGGVRSSAILAAAIVLLTEGMNAWAIRRVGSLLFIGPLAIVLLVVGGVAIALGRGRRALPAEVSLR
jgi:hypothetical protein